MKKFFALCSMIVALGFVAGCTPKGAPAPAAPAGDAATESGDATETPAADEGAAGGDE
ncbi:MAG: hypothetical protein FWE95_01960 [Planctomycetaceae bacterium]|nr:hypothetical protein [Planctomycetaceae bacterium]